MTTLVKPDVLPDTSRLEFDAKKHVYTLDGKKLTGVTSVIDGTSSKQNLIQWAANMAVDYVQENTPILVSTDAEVFNLSTGESTPQMDAAYWNPVKEVLDAARTAHTRKRDKAATKGTDVHALVEEYILECIHKHKGFLLPGAPAISTNPAWEPIMPFMDWAYKNVDRFLAAEQMLYSTTHGYAGTCDFVALIDGKLTIGDLKTFPKMWSADPFIQCGAYSAMWRELTGEQPEQSVIVKMCDPEDERIKKYGGKAFAVYPRHALAEDEEIFLKRLDIYRYNQNFTSPKE